MNKKMGTWVKGMSVIGNVHRLLVRTSGSKHFVGVLTLQYFISPHSLSLSLCLFLPLSLSPSLAVWVWAKLKIHRAQTTGLPRDSSQPGVVLWLRRTVAVCLRVCIEAAYC